MTETYLDHCLKEGHIVRWPERMMPIHVYIGPFRWYENTKQQASTAYNKMVLDALDVWKAASDGRLSFRLVNRMNDSMMDINWRRVDRTSLGHCEYLVNQDFQLYSAEIKIGISDGLVHARYNDMEEVKHTILHEIGHALGIIGHSPFGGDIMYVPHEYGVTDLSFRDMNTLKRLYQLPVGFDWQQYAKRHNLPKGTTFHDVLDHRDGKPLQQKVSAPSASRQKTVSVKNTVDGEKILDHHHAILSQMGKFHLATQNIASQPHLKKRFMDGHHLT